MFISEHFNLTNTLGSVLTRSTRLYVHTPTRQHVDQMKEEKKTHVKANPFTRMPIFAEESSSLFVDRRDQLDRIDAFLRLHEKGTILIGGERGIGKTSLLYRVASKVSRQMLIVNITNYFFEPNRSEFLRNVALGIYHELERGGPSPFEEGQKRDDQTPRKEMRDKVLRALKADSAMLGPGIYRSTDSSFPGERPSVYDLESYLDRILEETAKVFGKLVIMIDDFDKIPPEDAAPLMMMTRPLLSQKGVFFIIVAGTNLWEVLGHEIQVARSISDLEILLEGLSREDLGLIVEKRLKEHGGPTTRDLFESDAFERILEYSGGNPASLIQVCSDSLDRAVRANTIVTNSQVEEAIKEKETSMLRSLDTEQLQLVDFIGRSGEVKASEPELGRILGLSRPRTSQILNQLGRWGVLTRRRRGRSVLYSLTDEMKSASKDMAKKQ